MSILLGSGRGDKCSIFVELKGWWHKRPLGGKYLLGCEKQRLGNKEGRCLNSGMLKGLGGLRA